MTLTSMGHKPGLYVGERGDIWCGEHAPFAGSDTWRFGHYIRITPGWERLWAEDTKRYMPNGQSFDPPSCETCGKTREEAEHA